MSVEMFCGYPWSTKISKYILSTWIFLKHENFPNMAYPSDFPLKIVFSTFYCCLITDVHLVLYSVRIYFNPE